MIALYCNRLILHFFILGIGSGIPFFLTLSTLSFWLTESRISPSLIGLFTWVTLPYAFKFLLSPLLHKFTGLFHGRILCGLKIWGGLAHVGVIASTFALGSCDPHAHIIYMAAAAFLLSFFAACQDIVTDALRLSIFNAKQSGAGAAIESIGFRIGMLIGGAGTLYLASLYDWKMAYWLMAILQILVIPALLFLPKIDDSSTAPHAPTESMQTMMGYLKESLTHLYNSTPFISLLILIFIFKMPDTILNAMSAPFLHEIGFDKIEYANITKAFGIPLMIVGSLIAGYLIHQLGILLVVALALGLQAVSCLLFVIQFLVGHDSHILMLTIGIESFTSGMASAAFIALISLYCRAPFSAGHFTFLYAIGSLSRVIVSSIAGVAADTMGWNGLFFVTALTTIFAFLCLITIRKQWPNTASYSTERTHSMTDDQSNNSLQNKTDQPRLTSSPNRKAKTERQERLSAALRENLKKRKVQQKERKEHND